MPAEGILGIAAILQLLVPSVFHAHFSSNIMWRAMKGSYVGDEQPVKEFFQDIESGSFRASSKRDAFDRYVSFGIEVFETYLGLVLTSLAALAVFVAYRDSWIALVTGGSVVIGSLVSIIILDAHIGSEAEGRIR